MVFTELPDDIVKSIIDRLKECHVDVLSHENSITSIKSTYTSGNRHFRGCNMNVYHITDRYKNLVDAEEGILSVQSPCDFKVAELSMALKYPQICQFIVTLVITENLSDSELELFKKFNAFKGLQRIVIGGQLKVSHFSIIVEKLNKFIGDGGLWNGNITLCYTEKFKTRIISRHVYDKIDILFLTLDGSKDQKTNNLTLANNLRNLSRVMLLPPSGPLPGLYQADRSGFNGHVGICVANIVDNNSSTLTSFEVDSRINFDIDLSGCSKLAKVMAPVLSLYVAPSTVTDLTISTDDIFIARECVYDGFPSVKRLTIRSAPRKYVLDLDDYCESLLDSCPQLREIIVSTWANDSSWLGLFDLISKKSSVKIFEFRPYAYDSTQSSYYLDVMKALVGMYREDCLDVFRYHTIPNDRFSSKMIYVLAMAGICSKLELISTSIELEDPVFIFDSIYKDYCVLRGTEPAKYTLEIQALCHWFDRDTKGNTQQLHFSSDCFAGSYLVVPEFNTKNIIISDCHPDSLTAFDLYKETRCRHDTMMRFNIFGTIKSQLKGQIYDDVNQSISDNIIKGEKETRTHYYNEKISVEFNMKEIKQNLYLNFYQIESNRIVLKQE